MSHASSNSSSKKQMNQLFNSSLMSAGNFEDFLHNTVILPAAEPAIIETKPQQELDQKVKFIVGEPTGDSLNSDNFSEISLDRDTTSDVNFNDNANNNEYNPLADLDNYNPTFGQQPQPLVDQNYNPISAALAQLPTAASTVFSTFSNIIKGSIPAQEQPTESYQTPSFDPGYCAPTYEYTQEINTTPAPPPTFFSPTDANTFRKTPQETSTGNNFRLTSTKKTYAHIPGLHTNQPIQAPPAVGNFYGSSLPSEQIPPTQQFTPIFAPEPPKYQEAPHFQAPYQQTSFIAEEPKVSPKTSKFSLSSLIPTQILDKIPVNSFLAKEEFVQTKSEVSQAYNPRSSYEDVSFVTSPSETQAPIQTLVVEPTVINPQFFNKSPFYATPTTPVAQQLHQEAPPIVPEIPSQFAGPPPTFFNPENLQTKPVGLPEGSNRNPYSSGIGSRRPALYKNPGLIKYANTGPILLPTNPSVPSTASIYNPSGQTNNFINPSNQQPFASQPPIQLVQTAPPINFFNPIQLDAASSTSLNSSQRSTPASFVNQPLPSAPILSKNPSPADIAKPPVPFFQPQQVFQTQSVQPVPTEKSDSPPKFLAPIEQVHAAEAILDNSPKISDFNQSEITTPSNFFQPTPPGHTQATSTPKSVPAKPLSLFNPAEVAAGKPSFNFFNPTSQSNSFFNPLQQVENNKSSYQLPGAESPSSVRLFNPGQLDNKSPVTFFNPSSFGGDLVSSHFGPPATGTRSGDFFEEQNDKLPPPPEIQEQVDFGENLPLPLPPTDKQVADFEVKPDIASFFGGPAAEPTKSAFAAYFTPSNVNFFNNTDTVEEKIESAPKKDTAGVFLPEGPPSVQFQQAQNIGPQGFFNASPHVVQGSAQLLDQTQVGQGNQLQNPYQKEVPLASSFFGISVQPEPAFLVPKDPPQTQYSEDSCSQIESFSVSEPIGSTLSLFATSEFVDDSSSNRDTSVVNPELLISTYLKQTSEQEQDVIDQNCSSFSPSEGQDGKTLFKLTSEELLKLLENPDQHEVDIMAALDSLDGAAPATSKIYRPVYKHWFYQHIVDTKTVWAPFTMADSLHLDEADQKNNPENLIIPTDGGRFDVNIRERKKAPVYWTGDATEVRRCSWFYKGVDSRFVPYDEGISDLLEHEFEEASTNGDWHRRISLPNGELVVFHDANVIVHFQQTTADNSWGQTQTTTNRPRVVKRGVDEFNIDDGEPEKIDHLLFMVHGIGSVCDLKFRTVEEVVDEFRNISHQLVQSHYRSLYDQGEVGRVEVLPVSWYSSLHSEESGIDEKLKAITLESIPKLRQFTNETLLDILFYTSPVFCQSIMDTVSTALNRLYTMFCARNPNFKGNVSLGGHSLGSLILFDLLCHQKPKVDEKENSENPDAVLNMAQHRQPLHKPLQRTTSKQINYTMSHAGTGQAAMVYPQLVFEPSKFFALGSPIGMFVTIRGIDKLGMDFRLPTCDGFYNIFHPYDPVAYRIEALINPELRQVGPVVIPHHKGRKRMHLELRETMTRVGADIKQKVLGTFKNTLETVYALTSLHKPISAQSIESEVDAVLEKQQLAMEVEAGGEHPNSETTLPLGMLNQTRRIDYVLQEAPLEFFNEYIFALTSHVCYWDSEDTILFIVKEIYSSMGLQADSQVPQHSMTIERPLLSPTGSANQAQTDMSPNSSPSKR